MRQGKRATRGGKKASVNPTEVDQKIVLSGIRRGGKDILCAIGLAVTLALLSLGLAGRAEGAPAIECSTDSAPYRINAGGPEQQTPNGVFCEDTQEMPSNYVNHEAAGNRTLVLKTAAPAIDMSDPSIPEGTPEALFRTERWDPRGSQVDGQSVPNSEMSYAFPVTPGAYEVRLYFAEIWNKSTTDPIDANMACCQAEGKRVFDVLIDGDIVLDDYDVFKEAGGGFKGIVETFTVTSENGILNVDFQHVVQNPAIKAIEVLPIAPPVDTADPTISGLKPSGKTRDRTPRISAVVRDAGSELGKSDIKLYVDGKARTFSYNEGTDKLSATSRRLSYGGHTVKVVATDDSGNKGQDTSRFKVVKKRR